MSIVKVILLIVLRSKLVNEEASIFRDAVFASTDGVVTSFSIVTAAVGAGLGSRVLLILGVANLIASGISMSSGFFLGTQSEIEMEKKLKNSHWKQDAPLLQAIVTFFSYVAAGFLPLIPFVFKMDNPIFTSVGLVLLALVAVGSLKAFAVGKNIIGGALEMLIIGGVAALAAYGVGKFAESVIR